MQPKFEHTLEVIHELMREAMETATAGARSLGKIDTDTIHDNQLLETLADLREKYKPVVSGMKKTEALAGTLDILLEKIQHEDPSAPLFERGAKPTVVVDEPAGRFVDAPPATVCFRCDKTLRKSQAPAWVAGPDGTTAKIHASCLQDGETAQPQNVNDADDGGAPTDPDAARAAEERLADAGAGAVRHPRARKPKLVKLSAKKAAFRMART